MKKLVIIAVIAVMAASIAADAAPQPAEQGKGRPRRHIAVVRSRYDEVDVVLGNFHIPYDLLEYRDLEKAERLARYRVLFVGSGADNPVEESLDIYANNLRFQAVILKRDYYEVDQDLVARNIRRFVKNGGAAYFSGYSFTHLQRAFDLFEFFDDFPYMGLPERIEAAVTGDLARFGMKGRMALYQDHPGWVTLKSARDAEIVARASFSTPRGVRSGPITVIARRGDGEILYTSYDSTVFSDFRRFNIYRIAGNRLVRDLEEIAGKWGQRVTGRIVDAIHGGEYGGMHRIDLAGGENTIYFHSDREAYQIDIVDRDLSLMESRDIADREQRFTVRSGGDDHCFIRVYPSTGARYGMYAVVSAAGRRLFPYGRHLLIALGIALAAGAGAMLFRLFHRGGYAGRWRG